MKLERIKAIGQIPKKTLHSFRFASFLRDETQSRWKGFTSFWIFFEIGSINNKKLVSHNWGS